MRRHEARFCGVPETRGVASRCPNNTLHTLYSGNMHSG